MILLVLLEVAEEKGSGVEMLQEQDLEKLETRKIMLDVKEKRIKI